LAEMCQKLTHARRYKRPNRGTLFCRSRRSQVARKSKQAEQRGGHLIFLVRNPFYETISAPHFNIETFTKRGGLPDRIIVINSKNYLCWRDNVALVVTQIGAVFAYDTRPMLCSHLSNRDFEGV
jgi:hypothetical protein